MRCDGHTLITGTIVSSSRGLRRDTANGSISIYTIWWHSGFTDEKTVGSEDLEACNYIHILCMHIRVADEGFDSMQCPYTHPAPLK